MAARTPSKAPGPHAKDMFDEDDLSYFRAQSRQADLAQQALEAGEVRPGAKAAYVAFHDGKELARGAKPQELVMAWQGLPRAEVYVMFLPGRHDVLVY